jgi:hypothetical protein
VQLDSAAVNDNPDDFEVWRGWNDTLVVVKAEPPLLIPSSVVGDFADLPDWAKRGSDATTPADHQPESSTERKRDRLSPPSGDLMPNSYVVNHRPELTFAVPRLKPAPRLENDHEPVQIPHLRHLSMAVPMASKYR